MLLEYSIALTTIMAVSMLLAYYRSVPETEVLSAPSSRKGIARYKSRRVKKCAQGPGQTLENRCIPHGLTSWEWLICDDSPCRNGGRI